MCLRLQLAESSIYRKCYERLFPRSEMHTYSYLVSWCFKPSQPQRVISGLKETSIKKYVVERTKKAEIRPEEHSGKAESCQMIEMKINIIPESDLLHSCQRIFMQSRHVKGGKETVEK